MHIRSGMLIAIAAALFAAFATYLFFGGLYGREREVVITVPLSSGDVPQDNNAFVEVAFPEPPASTTVSDSAIPPAAVKPVRDLDLPPQAPLSNPPRTIKAVYATSWSAGSSKKMDYLIGLIQETELNAIVIDIKDFSGYVAYRSELAEVKKYNALEVRIPKVNALIKRLHDDGIYVIARLSVFQDPRLALARPDLAIMSSTTGETWLDYKGLAWIDPASQEAWDYTVAIAREALARGFDEINFDYIRFPSDGKLAEAVYPFWDQKKTRARVMKEFWEYLRSELSGAVLSADLFGLTTVNYDDLGIGQNLESAFPSFDHIAPMVYPSHYASGFIGYKNPAEHPYEVVRYSMDAAVKRLATYNRELTAGEQAAAGAEPAGQGQAALAEATSVPPSSVKFRPWLQDFNLGAAYGADKVRAQIQAVNDSFCGPASGQGSQSCGSSAHGGLGDAFGGWMLWNPSNIYTKGALEPAIGQ